MSGVRIFVQGPQPMGIKHQSPIRLPGVEPRTLGGELCLMGKTTGRERLGKSAFTQLPGALGQVGAAGQGFHGDPLAEPGGPRGDSMPEQGRRFGFDAALYARLPVRAGAGVGKGLLGGFIGAAHLVAKLYRINPRELLDAQSMEEQRAVFDAKFAPLFERKLIRWLTDQPASLFGLGIPPAQYDALAGDSKMAAVLLRRLERLACDYDLKQNYFAWQAFGRGYGKGADAPLPPYLQAQNYEAVVARADRVNVVHANMTDWMGSQGDASLDRYILLDAQDWMSDAQLTALWSQITRTAKRGARVLFRTAAEPTLLPGRVPDALLDRWEYRAAESLEYTSRDRSSIYGGVHLYVLKGD